MLRFILKWLGLASNENIKPIRKKYKRVTNNIRKQVIELHESGVKVKDIAELVDISKTSAYRIINKNYK